MLTAERLGLKVQASSPPPAASLLGQAIADRFGTTPAIDVEWTRRALPSSADVIVEKARTIVAGWIKGTALSIGAVAMDGTGSLLVDLVGSNMPTDVSGLRRQLAPLVPARAVSIRFTMRVELKDPPSTTTTPITAPR